MRLKLAPIRLPRYALTLAVVFVPSIVSRIVKFYIAFIVSLRVDLVRLYLPACISHFNATLAIVKFHPIEQRITRRAKSIRLWTIFVWFVWVIPRAKTKWMFARRRIRFRMRAKVTYMHSKITKKKCD